MTDLGLFTLLIGVILTAMHGAIVLAPSAARDVMARFPRDRWTGRVLSALGLLWGGWLLHGVPLGPLDPFKTWLWFLTPAIIGLTWIYCSELLAPRALGGILLLVPAPWLALARLHPSSLTWVASLVAYITVIKGCGLVLSPYLFRRVTSQVYATDGRARAVSAVGVGIGVLLVLLAVCAYG